MKMKRLKRLKTKYGFFQPNGSQNNPMGDADLHIDGMSQSLNFKDIASVFPEKVICDLVLSVVMVEKNTDVIIIADQSGYQNEKSYVMQNVYQKIPAVQEISWTQSTQGYFVYQGTMYPKSSTFNLTMAANSYTFPTLEDGEKNLEENQYYDYGGFWDNEETMDRIVASRVRFLADDPISQDQIQDTEDFGDKILRGGISIQLSKSDYNIQSIQMYKSHHSQQFQQDHLNINPKPCMQNYRSIHFEMLGQNTMRVHFFQSNKS